MITIEYNDRDILEALQNLQRATDNLQPALDAIGEELTESTKQRFSSQIGPDGQRWKANSPVTIDRKGRDQPLIGETGKLMDEIDYNLFGPDTLEIGSPMEYAATQQFGAKMGEFGRYSQIGRVRKYGLGTFQGSAGTQKGFPIPWGDIPARPFLGISDDDKNEILSIIADHLSDALK